MIQIHPTFLALKDTLNGILLAVKQLNELYNPLIGSEESDLLTDTKRDAFLVHSKEEYLHTESPGCKDDVSFRDVILLTSLICFAIVAIRCLWNYRSVENKCFEESQVEKRKTFIKDDCSRLKELHKTLLSLKHYMKILPENRKTSPFILNPMADTMREMTNRSLYSNVSRKQVAGNNTDRDENMVKLRESLQKAILMLEEQIGYKAQIADDTEIDYRNTDSTMEGEETANDVFHFPKQPVGERESVTTGPGASHIDLRRLLKVPNSNPALFLFEKQMDIKSFVADDADKQKPTEPCKECSKMKETLLFLKRQLDNKSFKPNVLTNCNSLEAPLKCSTSAETQNSLILNMPPSSPRTCDCKSFEVNGKRATANREGDILNVNANKNTLNIEILFNRNIQLDKIIKES